MLLGNKTTSRPPLKSRPSGKSAEDPVTVDLSDIEIKSPSRSSKKKRVKVLEENAVDEVRRLIGSKEIQPNEALIDQSTADTLTAARSKKSVDPERAAKVCY